MFLKNIFKSLGLFLSCSFLLSSSICNQTSSDLELQEKNPCILSFYSMVGASWMQDRLSAMQQEQIQTNTTDFVFQTISQYTSNGGEVFYIYTFNSSRRGTHYVRYSCQGVYQSDGVHLMPLLNDGELYVKDLDFDM